MQVWFITGASRGLGALMAEQALAKGHTVVATARNAAAVLERFGARPDLLALSMDVTDETLVHQAVADAIARVGRIDVLVNNAGYGLLGAVEEATGAEVEALYRTNVFGLLNVARAVLPHMRHQRSGRILNVSSIGGYRSAAGFGVYCSTKFAVEGLSEALADELRPLGIYVSVLEPGYTRTDFLDARSLAVSNSGVADYDETVGAVRRKAAAISHQQPGDPVKLAQIVVDFAQVENPPVRLPLGSDTVAAIEAKIASDSAILDAWRVVSGQVDFAAQPVVE